MTNMRVFQIQKNEVLIINGDKQYSDTVENFKLDSKLSLNDLTEVIYDNYQECCVINKEFKEYPNANFDNYIDNVDTYIKAKEKREYIPPKEPTLDELKEAKSQKAGEVFATKRDAIRWVKVDEIHTYGFDCASEDITNFLAAYTFLDTQVEKSNTTMYKVWLDKENKGIVELNLEQMSTVFNNVRTSQFEAYAWLEQVQTQIEACQSKEDLDAIVLE